MLVELFQALYESFDEARLRRSTVRGYKVAWRARQRTGDASVELLLSGIAKEGSGEQLSPPYSPDVEQAVQSWKAGATPSAARTAIREAAAR
jgi:hypothetical protein